MIFVSEFSTSDSTDKNFGFAYTGVTVGAFVAPVMLWFVSDTIDNQVMYALIDVFYAAAVLTVVLIYVGMVPDADEADSKNPDEADSKNPDEADSKNPDEAD